MTPVRDRIASLLYPLTDFYTSEGRSFPHLRVLEGEQVPQPYRQLLVHDSDMTPTLEAFHGDTIHLERIRVQQVGSALHRQVRLVTDADATPVEFGAIRIELDRYPEDAREKIVEGYLPLGTILARYHVEHASRPTAWFEVDADDLIADSLKLQPGPTLYGRHNVIRNPDGEPLAEVVEILPPVEKAEKEK